MKTEKYQPTPEDIDAAEKSLTPEQRQKSISREEAFNSLRPPRFDAAKGTILFDLDKRLIETDRLKQFAESDGFAPKEEYHFTIIGFNNGRKMADALKGMSVEERARHIQEIETLIKETNWRLGSTPRLFRVSKEYPFRNPQTNAQETETRETIIQVLEFSELENFCRRLSQVIGRDIKPQFPHITLYTKGTNKVKSKMGIGIDTLEDFNKLKPRPIDIS